MQNPLRNPGHENSRSAHLLTGLVLIVLLGVTAPRLSQAAGSAENDVRCTEVAFSLSVENKDSEAFAAFLDEDTRFVSQSVLRGSAAVAEAWSVFFTESGPELVWRPYIVEVAATGDIALSRGPYRARTLNEAGEVVESWGIYNSVWRKAPGGSWKIIFDAGNAGENQVTEELKALIDLPVADCGF